MKRIRANDLFSVWSPDEVVECLDGIGPELYAKVWNDIVPLYANKKRSEVNDDFARRCLKKFWSRFTDEEKLKLNAAAEKHEAQYSCA